jgi:hypothetical protein
MRLIFKLNYKPDRPGGATVKQPSSVATAARAADKGAAVAHLRADQTANGRRLTALRWLLLDSVCADHDLTFRIMSVAESSSI